MTDYFMVMKVHLPRVVTHSMIVAVACAAVGCGLAEAVGVFFATQAIAQDWSEPVIHNLRRQMPLGMAVWGVGLVVLFEFLAWLVKGTPPNAFNKPADQAESLWAELRKRVDPPAG